MRVADRFGLLAAYGGHGGGARLSGLSRLQGGAKRLCQGSSGWVVGLSPGITSFQHPDCLLNVLVLQTLVGIGADEAQ